MELTKNTFNYSKIIKSAIFVLIGTALLAISSKIQTQFTLADNLDLDTLAVFNTEDT